MLKKTTLFLTLALCMGLTNGHNAYAAGELFPPQNSEQCTHGTGLIWVEDAPGKAHLECQPISSKIDNKTCETGQIARSIQGNIVDCLPLKNLLDTDACPQGQVVQEIRDGKGLCVVNPLNISCQSNQIMQGISSNGQAVCVNKPSFKSCLTGTYLTAIRSDGSISCSAPKKDEQNLTMLCPEGKIMTGIQNNQALCNNP